MDRTFHQRLTVGAVSGIILLLALSLYAFWVKSVVLGLLLVLALVLVTERTLHTEYVFRDGNLIVDNGRLSREKVIPLRSIRSCRPMATVFGLVRYLLITYGDDSCRMVSVQPDNEKAFVEHLRKAKKEETDEEQ